jgi:hypothetical protein
VTVNNHLTVATAGQTYSAAAAVSNIQTSSGVIEGYVNAFSNGDNSQILALVASTSSTSFNYLPNSIGWQNGQQLEVENNNGGTPSVVATSSINPTAPFVLGVYGNSLYVNYRPSATISGNILGTGYLSIEDGSGTTVPEITYNWVRTRAVPPNSVMPSIAGSTSSLTSVAVTQMQSTAETSVTQPKTSTPIQPPLIATQFVTQEMIGVIGYVAIPIVVIATTLGGYLSLRRLRKPRIKPAKPEPKIRKVRCIHCGKLYDRKAARCPYCHRR